MTTFSKILMQWHELLINFSVSKPIADEVFEIIREAYQEDGRYYHNLNHIEAILKTVSELDQLANDYAVIQLAAWFHDIVYDSKASDNELQSARMARQLMEQMSLPRQTIAKVEDLILATADHLNPENDPDINILLDADLAILGSDEISYARYASNVHLEYAWVDDEVYRLARIQVLEGFLQRPSIYRTQVMNDRFESSARENIKREIARLSS